MVRALSIFQMWLKVSSAELMMLMATQKRKAAPTPAMMPPLVSWSRLRENPMRRATTSSCPASCSMMSCSSRFCSPKPLAIAKAMASTGTIESAE